MMGQDTETTAAMFAAARRDLAALDPLFAASTHDFGTDGTDLDCRRCGLHMLDIAGPCEDR